MLDTFRVQDPVALRAIAHPLRQRILLELATLGHARAADLAKATGEPANAVSFHLRVLAKAGLIVEAPEHARDRRDRVWTNVAASYAVEPDTPTALRDVVRPTLAWAEENFRRANESGGSPEGRILAITALVLTPDQATAMAHELAAVLRRWSDDALAAARVTPDEPREAYQVLAVLAPRELSPAHESAS